MIDTDPLPDAATARGATAVGVRGRAESQPMPTAEPGLPTRRPGRRPRLRGSRQRLRLRRPGPRTLLALLAGALMGTAFEPFDWWPMAILAVAALTLLVRGRRPREGARSGYLFGLGLGAVAITWVGMLGWWVAPILVAVVALWWLAIGWLLALLQSVRGSWFVASSVWVLAEFSMAHFPFGGFPWLRLAWTTIDQPLSGFLPVVGAVGTSWVTALAGQAVAALARPRPLLRNRLVTRLVAVVFLGALFLTGGLLKARPVPASAGPTVNIGIVQGDVSGTAGSHAMGYARSVTANHLSETITLMAKARTGLTPMPDVLLWPENSTDIDPTLDRTTHERMVISEMLAGRPIVLGAVTAGPQPSTRQTTSMWWTTLNTVQSQYQKRNLVPFGEYIPFRSLVLPLVPVLKQVGQQSVAGSGPGVLTGTLNDGRTVRMGAIICFELAWDSTVADTVTHGADLVVVQSNNSDYTGTGQPRQQFMITRGRAMELRREIVVSTTNSFSGLIDARGRVLVESREGTSFSQTVTVPERTGVTLGVRADPWLDWASLVIVGVALLARIAGAFSGRRRGRVRV